METQEKTTLLIVETATRIGTSGEVITTLINSEHLGKNKNFELPNHNSRALIRELNMQMVIILRVNVIDVLNNIYSVELQPVNGESLNLTQFPQYTLLVETISNYVTTNNLIVGEKNLQVGMHLTRRGDPEGLSDIEIMAVVDGFIMARRNKTHPFVYTIKDFKQVFIKDCGYTVRPNTIFERPLVMEKQAKALIRDELVAGQKYGCIQTYPFACVRGSVGTINEELNMVLPEHGFINTKGMTTEEFYKYFDKAPLSS